MSAGLWRRLGELPTQLWVQIPALPSTCSVTLGRSHNLPEPQPDSDITTRSTTTARAPHVLDSQAGFIQWDPLKDPHPHGSCIHVLVSQTLKQKLRPVTGKV